MPARIAFIYAMLDPRDSRVRYVGKTVNLRKRLRTHLRDSRTGCYAVHRWIRNLDALGLKPEMVVLEAVDECDWTKTEEKWIAYYRSITPARQLLNMTDGGDGGPELRGSQHGNAVLTEELVQAIREERAEGATYAQLTAKYHMKPGAVGHLCTGRGWKHAGGPISHPRLVRRFTDEEALAIRRLYASGAKTQKEIAAEYDTKPSVIGKICRGEQNQRAGGTRTDGRKRSQLWTRGEGNGLSKLTASDVLQIRLCYASRKDSQQRLGSRFGVSQATIALIVKGRAWKEVAGPISAPKFRPKRLSTADKQRVRELHAEGVSFSELARRFGVSRSGVTLIARQTSPAA